MGNGTFEVQALPIEAQIAPVNGMVSQDVNNDGFLDVILIGNDYGNEIFTGRLDAQTGLVLIGDGNGNFKSLAYSNSAVSYTQMTLPTIYSVLCSVVAVILNQKNERSSRHVARTQTR